MKLYFSLFCNDIQAQLAYYLALLGVPEAVKSRSPIYRCIQATSFEFGFHAAPAYALLGLADCAPAPMHASPVTAYATFMLGGRIVKAHTPRTTANGKPCSPTQRTTSFD